MLLHCRRAGLGIWTGHKTQCFKFKSVVESGKLNIEALTKCDLESSTCLAWTSPIFNFLVKPDTDEHE